MPERLHKKNRNDADACLGLSEKEAGKRLIEYGPNLLSGKKKISPLKLFLSQFADVMVIILVISAAISALLREAADSATIIAIVVLNAVLGFVQEFRTEKTMEALRSLAAPAAKVIRDGRAQTVPAEQVVPGDIVILEAGDRVPADGVLLGGKSIMADESLLTGESVPVDKFPAPEGVMPEHAGRKNMVFMGTSITGGRAKAMVTATGMKTEMGGIADLIRNIEEDRTPLQKKLDKLGKIIAAGCLAICAAVAATGILRGEDVFGMLLSGLSLAVAAVPEGLPAIVTISLALGVRRMLKRNVLVRKLPAVETLGYAGVICSDKTGTLTQNKMTVRKIYSCGRMLEVNAAKKGKHGKDGFYDAGRKIDPLENGALKQLLGIAAICNNTVLADRNATDSAAGTRNHGNPTEIALLDAAAMAGLDFISLSSRYERIDELPFDSDRKCMSVVCRDRSGRLQVFSKGAPDVILKKCAMSNTAAGIARMTAELRSKAEMMNDMMAGQALRVIAIAHKNLESAAYDRERLESGLVFDGLVGMQDPPRPEAAEAVLKCRRAGIKPVMITGDHKLTAMSIARELDIYRDGEIVLTGAELDAMEENKLAAMAGNVSVYARVSPRHKLMIVRALKKLGNMVAMTGDGVNDAPAVKEADIGVAMGGTGTDVTKEAASMVILDDNFASIVAAIEEGRVIYSNIRKFVRYILACNIGEVLTMFLGMVIGLPIPLLPIQVLWVNLVTDGLPAVALGFDPPEKDFMKKPPRKPNESIFSHGLGRIIIYRGLLIGLTTLAVFTSIIYYTGNIGLARTCAFVTLVLTQLIHVFECKSENASIFEIPLLNNPYLAVAVMCSLAMLLAVVYIPPLQGIFKTVPPGLNEWLLTCGLSFLVPTAASFFHASRR